MNQRRYFYRSDIDGLRAISIFGVLIFHFFPKLLPGGFIGVDVFFVISGYLVTKIILKDIANRQFSIINFYTRRMRRLFPGLLLVLATTTIFGAIFLVADEFALLGKHLFGGTVFIQNFFLHSESGYFDTSSDLKPLLHLWSLAVEEQFYLVWPFFLLIGSRLTKFKTSYLIFSSFIVSLLLSMFLTENHSSFSFYLLPTRLWELAAGGLVVFWEDHPWIKLLQQKKMYSWYSLKGFGLFLILVSFVLIDGTKSIPGLWALLPVLGTITTILVKDDKVITPFLSTPLLVYLGLVSYPLYLWHWPIVAFSHMLLSNTPPFWLNLLFILISILLGCLTYELIEKKTKTKESKKFYSTLILGQICIAFIGIIIWTNNGFPTRYPKIEARRVLNAEFKSTKDTHVGQICMNKYFEIELCAASNINSPPTVALIGDSHANHYFPGFKKYYGDGESLVGWAKSGTPPFYRITSKRNPDSDLNDVFDYILKSSTIHTVILAGFWANYAQENGVYLKNYMYKNIIKDMDGNLTLSQQEVFRLGLERTFSILTKAQKKIIFIHDIAALPFELKNCLPRPFLSSFDSCNFSLKIEERNQQLYRQILNQTLKSFPNVQVLDPMPALCPNRNEKCSISHQGFSMYTDEHHLSSIASKHIVQFLMSGKFESENLFHPL